MRIIIKTGILHLALAACFISCQHSAGQYTPRDDKELSSITKSELARDSILLDSIKKFSINPPDRTGGQAQYGKQR